MSRGSLSYLRSRPTPAAQREDGPKNIDLGYLRRSARTTASDRTFPAYASFARYDDPDAVLDASTSFLTALFLFIAGFFREFIQDLALGMNTGGGPLESLARLVTNTTPTGDLDPTAGLGIDLVGRQPERDGEPLHRGDDGRAQRIPGVVEGGIRLRLERPGTQAAVRPRRHRQPVAPQRGRRSSGALARPARQRGVPRVRRQPASGRSNRYAG